jgi:hypothetical protein
MEKEEAAPFTEDLTKQELVDHLLQVHQAGQINGQRVQRDATKVKVTKGELVHWHEHAHRILDAPDDQRYQHGQAHVGNHAVGRQGVTRLPSVEHVHSDAATAPEVRAMLDRAVNNEPLVPEGQRLNASERSALTRLVDNDYAALRADLQSLAAATLGNDLKQLELDWEDRRQKSARWLQQLSQASDKFMKKREDLRALAAADGIEITFAHTSRDHLRAEARTAGYDKAVADARQRNKRLLDTALLKLERERLRAQRRILLSAVSGAAAEILETIPSAEQMLTEAMAREQAGAAELETSTSSR